VALGGTDDEAEDEERGLAASIGRLGLAMLPLALLLILLIAGGALIAFWLLTWFIVHAVDQLRG
jgi:hypothetical protein